VNLRRPRARDLGIPFEGEPGPLNAITDVGAVEVGHVTLVRGEGPLKVGAGPVRTGVTAVFPRGKASTDPAFAGWFALNGNGEITGTAWIEESGFLDGPVLITNTHSVGTVRDAVIAWRLARSLRPATNPFGEWHLPVVSETWDGYLNDINGFHVRPEHVFGALDGAAGGPVAEGNVGGGTGMICYGWKGGIGTASRRLSASDGGFTVGVLAQCNAGASRDLRIAGVPVGLEMPAPTHRLPDPGKAPESGRASRAASSAADPGSVPEHLGSIVILVATDAPLLPHQLERVARRAALGYGRTGSFSHHTSGDLMLAFSTANPGAGDPAPGTVRVAMLANDVLDPVFRAAAEATEEAIVNALIAAQTMTGADGRTVPAIPHDRLRGVLRKYNRLRSR
jgi:L-aminopeptidase/D-esterase-like protein